MDEPDIYGQGVCREMVVTNFEGDGRGGSSTCKAPPKNGSRGQRGGQDEMDRQERGKRFSASEECESVRNCTVELGDEVICCIDGECNYGFRKCRAKPMLREEIAP